MKRIVVYISVICTMVLAGCAASPKTSATPEEIAALDDLVQQQSLEFVGEWAFPRATNSLNQISNAGLLPIGSNAGRINLIGNPNYLRIQNDSVSAYLPYFGERQFGGGYGATNSTGIQFEGVAEDLDVVKDEQKNEYSIQFNISEGTENYRVFLRLFANQNSTLNINSNQRFSIAYQGHFDEFNIDDLKARNQP